MKGPRAARKRNAVKILRGTWGEFGKHAFCQTSFYRPNYCHGAAIPTSDILSPNCGPLLSSGPSEDWVTTPAVQTFRSILPFA